ncbi:MAG: hypothetical protein KTR32_14590 [Granulosicoccus sp.]|nr:hypothetical protein [Granulosicoccus sp.]
MQVRLALATLALVVMTAGMTRVATADNYVVLNTVALHFKNADERRAFTPGIGWEYSPSSRPGFHLGTLSDSFGYQAGYVGINWATRQFHAGPVGFRFILGATVLHKQFHKNSEPETKVVPLPAVEVSLSERAVLNISGSPQIDYAGQRNNAVMFFQFKWNTD